MNRRLGLYLMALCVVTLWGASFPLTKAALEELGPSSIAFVRWTISAIVLAGWLAWRGRASGGISAAVAVFRREWRPILWLGFTGIAIYYTLQNFAVNYTTATNAGVLSNLGPLFIVLIGVGMLRERLNAVEWMAILASFAGSVLVSQGAGHLALGGRGLLGDVLMVVAGVAGAIYSIGAKQLTERHSPVIVTTLVAAAGAVLLLPVALVEGLRLDLPLATWGILAVIGIGSGAFANLWWLTLLARMPASRAALVLFLIPVIAAGLSVTALGEPVTLTLVLGAVLVCAGVLIVQRRTA